MTNLASLWESMVITDMARFAGVVARIESNAPRYRKVTAITGVPWQIIASLHEREASGSFLCHLHNGDPLSDRTVHVPKGYPMVGDPPFTWEESAQDALAGEGLCHRDGWADMGVTLDRIERFNGLGYRKRKENSPYLWAGTNHYRNHGKFVEDGHFDPNACDDQPGCAGLLKLLGYAA